MASRQKKSFFVSKFLLILYCILAAFSLSVCGQKLSVTHFTINDGLPQNTINCISQDEKGFFWIGTSGGLARFDGHEFVKFTQQQGLPSNIIFDFLKSDDGNFWLATKNGLVKFNPEGTIYNHVVTIEDSAALTEPPMFTTYNLPNPKRNRFTKLLQSSDGKIWVGTEIGLFRLAKNANEYRFEEIDIKLPPNSDKQIYEIYEDKKGAVWVGTEQTLTRISPANRVTYYQSEIPSAVFDVVLEDGQNRIWVGTNHQGLFQFTVDENETPQLVRQFATGHDSEIEWIDTISESGDGKLWIGGTNGLYEFQSADNKLFRYTRSSGLDFNRFQLSFKDRRGNLWLGTQSNGVYRLSFDGLVSFEAETNISFIKSIGFDKDNNVLLTGFLMNTALDKEGAKVQREISGKVSPPIEWHLGRLNENGFFWLIPNFPRPITEYGWGGNQLSLQTRNGEWWVVTAEGLFRFPAVEFENLKTTVPIAVYDEKTGLDSGNILHVFEDSPGNIWIATGGDGGSGLFKWEKATGTLRDMSATEGFSVMIKKEAIMKEWITSIAEDRRGNVWFSLLRQGFARLRNGKIDFWGNEQNVPPGGVASLFFDRENRLWAATRENGILRIDNPEAENPAIVNYTNANGLSSNRTLSIAQDKQGFIYIGTDRDVNLLNPQTERFRQLKLSKSLSQREFRSAICDKTGTLWFGTTEGLVKYTPSPDEFAAPPEILITGASIEGIPQKISAVGTTALNLPTLAPEQNQVRIDFVSLSDFDDEDIFYQYKLDDDGDWSKPNKEKFVNFANLSAGNYQILIRAVTSGGDVGENPAIISFKILSPIYLRWWFIALLFLLIGAIVYTFYRARIQKLLEIERARTLIATDLHDDIGSNLSKISVLSEVVRMQLANEGNSDNKLLGSIAEISRESVSSMRDIIWAINPKRDSALEIIRKMREYAEELFVPKGITVKFAEPDKGAKIKLPMDVRRDLYLIFKEAVNNIAKHSNCTAVKIDFNIHHQEIILQIEDNGRGFDLNEPKNGNGLPNMQNRVEKLRGYFQIESEPNHGTKINVRIPQH